VAWWGSRVGMGESQSFQASTWAAAGTRECETMCARVYAVPPRSCVHAEKVFVCGRAVCALISFVRQ
jgi:hypothetical protein